MEIEIGRAAVMVLAGGSGARFGAAGNKVYEELAGATVLSWSLNTLGEVPGVGPLLLVARPADRELVRRMLAAEVRHPVEVVDGGATRQESELCGLRHLADRIHSGEVDTVLIHDGARPLVSAELGAAIIAAARDSGGAIPGVPRTDLARASDDGMGLDGGAGPGMVAVQTPQGFAAGPLLAAYERAAVDGFAGTDTASCIQHYTEISVRCIPGEGRNFKITYAHDLRIADAVIARGTA
ncbi:IspD/TarI family cytidylyltransferase [Pseudonocardia spinosispora]|uniref:IspD/TarI family cytidylyltransferase n=1 Tax=Pseudonocardia spinosispora TaxID=103441 RepID=UPI00316AD53E